MMPVRIKLSRARGFDLQAHSLAINGLPARSCARPGPFGNPFRIGDRFVPDTAEAVRMFAARLPDAQFYLPPHPDSYMGRLIARLPDLRAHNLACWCKLGDPCHVDKLLELANQ